VKQALEDAFLTDVLWRTDAPLQTVRVLSDPFRIFELNF